MPDRRAAWGLIVLAVVARAAAVLVLQSHTVPHSTYEHGEIAANLLAGRGFSVRFLGADGPTSQQAPVYPIVVAAAYAVGGVGHAPGPADPGAGAGGARGRARGGRPDAGARGRAGAVWVARGRRPDRRAPPDARLRGHARPGRLAGRDPADLDPGLGLSGRARRGAIATRSSPGALLALLVLTDPILGLVAAGVVWAVVLGRGRRRAVRPLGLIAG